MISKSAANAIDLDNERVLSLGQAARYVSDKFPERRGGRPLNLSTVHRWVGRGVKGIRLEVIQVGGTRTTTIEAIHRFFERLAGREPAAVVARPSISQNRRVAAAEKSLEQAGI